MVFGCADSRVAAEIIFDQGLGDMTVVRTAGHVMGSAVLGSIEYAVTVLNVPLIVVLGHDSCGAVKATLSALDDAVVPGGYVRDLVERVIPSILLGRRDGLTRVDEFEARHVSETAAQLRRRSTAVAERLDGGRWRSPVSPTNWPTDARYCGIIWVISGRALDLLRLARSPAHSPAGRLPGPRPEAQTPWPELHRGTHYETSGHGQSGSLRRGRTARSPTGSSPDSHLSNTHRGLTLLSLLLCMSAVDEESAHGSDESFRPPGYGRSSISRWVRARPELC